MRVSYLLVLLAALLFAPSEAAAQITFTGSTGSGSPDFTSTTGTITTRINRDGTRGECGSTDTASAPFSGSFTYDAYTFTNGTGVSQCVTVTFDLSEDQTTLGNIYAAAYLGSFNPGNILENFLADAGLSTGFPGTAQSFSFDLAAGASFVLVLYDTNGDVGIGYTVAITPEALLNGPPVADAGGDQSVIAGQTVALDGSGSSDPNGDALTYAWTLDGPGYANAALTGVTPTFCAAAPGAYTAVLTVSDGELSDSDEVGVTAISVNGALGDLAAAVEAFGATGVLNGGLVRALTVKLEQARRLLDRGKTAAALAVLAGYEQQLADLVADGVLTADQAGALSAEAVAAVVASPCTVGIAIAEAGASASLAGDADGYALSSVFPNPFSGSTTVAFEVPEAADVRVAVYDVLGREVAVLAEGPVSLGRHEVVFEAGPLPQGAYLVRLTAGGGFAQVRRVTLAR